MVAVKRDEPNIPFAFSPRAKGTTTQEWVYQELRMAVLTGRFPPGYAMKPRNLSEILGVSSMPVREALRRLVSERALELPDNRRAKVPEMTSSKFDELIRSRVALETLAAERAMPLIDADRLRRLREIDQRSMEEIHAADIEENIILNYRFHRDLYMSLPSQVIMPLIESLWLQLGPFMRLAMSHLGEHYAVDRHSEAMDAIERQDSIALRIAIEADIRDGFAHLGKAELLDAYVRNSHAA